MFRISHQVVKTLPHMRSVPGVYQNGSANLKGSWLVDFRSACKAGLVMRGSNRTVEECAMHCSNLRNRALDDFLQQWREVVRYMAIIQAPVFIPATRELEFGFHCFDRFDNMDPSLSDDERAPQYRRKFTRASFAIHVDEGGCGAGRKLRMIREYEARAAS
ncbi:hypothetical protein IWZ01DRAFT_22463 [Phyllosticta capitalensis]